MIFVIAGLKNKGATLILRQPPSGAIIHVPRDSTSGVILNLPPSCFQLDVRHEAIIHVPRDPISGVILNLPPSGFQLDARHEAIIHVPRDPISGVISNFAAIWFHSNTA